MPLYVIESMKFKRKFLWLSKRMLVIGVKVNQKGFNINVMNIRYTRDAVLNSNYNSTQLNRKQRGLSLHIPYYTHN